MDLESELRAINGEAMFSEFEVIEAEKEGRVIDFDAIRLNYPGLIKFCERLIEQIAETDQTGNLMANGAIQGINFFVCSLIRYAENPDNTIG